MLLRRQIEESCLGPFLEALGTDLQFLLDQPIEGEESEPAIELHRPNGRSAHPNGNGYTSLNPVAELA